MNVEPETTRLPLVPPLHRSAASIAPPKSLVPVPALLPEKVSAPTVSVPVPWSLMPPPAVLEMPPLIVMWSIVTAPALVLGMLTLLPVPPLSRVGCVEPVPSISSVSPDAEVRLIVTDSAYVVEDPATSSVTAVPLSASAAVTPSWIVLHAPAPEEAHPVVTVPLTLSTKSVAVVAAPDGNAGEGEHAEPERPAQQSGHRGPDGRAA